MSSYEELADIYEDFMGDAPYDKWLQWLQAEFGDLSNLNIADVGCGTGTLTRMLAHGCKSVIGVDASAEMLGIAAQRALAQQVKIDWYCQDIRQLHLPYEPDLIVSSCDSLNYLLTAADFQQALEMFWQALRPGGVLAFDVVGSGRLRQLGDGFSYDLREDAAVFFESRVTEDVDIEYDLCAFVETESGMYRRFEETHRQRFYPADDVRKWLKTAGFELNYMAGDFADGNLQEALRVVFSAQKIARTGA